MATGNATGGDALSTADKLAYWGWNKMAIILQTRFSNFIVLSLFYFDIYLTIL